MKTVGSDANGVNDVTEDFATHLSATVVQQIVTKSDLDCVGSRLGHYIELSLEQFANVL